MPASTAGTHSIHDSRFVDHLLLPSLSSTPADRLSSRLRVVLAVVVQVAALAPRPQVLGRTVLRHVVEVRCRQHHLRACPIGRLAVLIRAAAFVRTAPALAAALASPPGSDLDLQRDLRPVVRVAVAVLWPNRAHASCGAAAAQTSSSVAVTSPPLTVRLVCTMLRYRRSAGAVGRAAVLKDRPKLSQQRQNPPLHLGKIEDHPA